MRPFVTKYSNIKEWIYLFKRDNKIFKINEVIYNEYLSSRKKDGYVYSENLHKSYIGINFICWQIAQNIIEYDYLLEKDVKEVYELLLLKKVSEYDGYKRIKNG